MNHLKLFEGFVNLSEAAQTHYELGDKYKSDFDYDGMLKLGLSVSSRWSISDLEKLAASFTDVNYHTECKFLLKAIEEFKNNKNIQLGNLFLKQFKDSIKENDI